MHKENAPRSLYNVCLHRVIHFPAICWTGIYGAVDAIQLKRNIFMCMSKTDFGLRWDEKEKEFVGYGYKNLYKRDILNRGKIKDSSWKEASFNSYCGPQTIDRLATSYDSKRYAPGFHIFLNENHARGYRSKSRNIVIVKVMFKGVVAFGTNDTQSVDYKSSIKGPCVISRYMKIVSVVKSKTVVKITAKKGKK